MRRHPASGCDRLLVATRNLSGFEPQAHLTDVIARNAAGHSTNYLDDVLPWADPTTPTLKAVA